MSLFVVLSKKTSSVSNGWVLDVLLGLKSCRCFRRFLFPNQDFSSPTEDDGGVQGVTGELDSLGHIGLFGRNSSTIR